MPEQDDTATDQSEAAVEQQTYVLATADAMGGDPRVLDVFKSRDRAEQVRDAVHAAPPRPNISRVSVYARSLR